MRHLAYTGGNIWDRQGRNQSAEQKEEEERERGRRGEKKKKGGGKRIINTEFW